MNMLSAYDLAQTNARSIPTALRDECDKVNPPVVEAEKRQEKESQETAMLDQPYIDSMWHELRVSLQGIYGNVSIFESSSKEVDHLLQSFDEEGMSPDFREKLIKCITQQKAALHIIDICAKQQKTVADDILLLSKLKAGKLELNLSLIDPKKLIQEVSHRLNKDITAKRLNFYLNFFVDELLVNADADRLRLILENLLSSAIKSAPEGGEITVTFEKPQIEPDNTILKFSIKDNGLCISEQERTQAFSSSPQESINMANKTVDSGLGWSISKKLITLMQGNIKVENEEGIGNKLSFSIKCPNAPKLKASSPHSPLVFSMGEPAINPNKCILIVEDNLVNQRLLQVNLVQSGFTCKIASNGQEAVDLFKTKKFCAILMDLEMPIMNGLEATKLIRQHEAIDLSMGAPVPIIVLSGTQPSSEFELSIFAHGANDYLTKPFDKVTLLEKIAQHTHKTQPLKIKGRAAF